LLTQSIDETVRNLTTKQGKAPSCFPHQEFSLSCALLCL